MKKLETITIITKGLCYIVIGGLTPLATGLGQWIDPQMDPGLGLLVVPKINWVVIIAGCFVGAATQMLSFLSRSFGEYTGSNGGPPVDNGAGQPPKTDVPKQP